MYATNKSNREFNRVEYTPYEHGLDSIYILYKKLPLRNFISTYNG